MRCEERALAFKHGQNIPSEEPYLGREMVGVNFFRKADWTFVLEFRSGRSIRDWELILVLFARNEQAEFLFGCTEAEINEIRIPGVDDPTSAAQNPNSQQLIGRRSILVWINASSISPVDKNLRVPFRSSTF